MPARKYSCKRISICYERFITPVSTQENLYKTCTIVLFGYVFSYCNAESPEYSNFPRWGGGGGGVETKQNKTQNYPVLFSVKSAFGKVLFYWSILKYTKSTSEMKRKKKELFVCILYRAERGGKNPIHSFYIKCREMFGLLTTGLVFVFRFMQHNTELHAEYITTWWNL